MRRVATCAVLMAVGMCWAGGAFAQATKQEPAKAPAQAKAAAALPTADELVEKHIAAMGGRAALAKLQTRTAVGTVTMSMQGNEIGGNVEIFAKAPNKSRSYLRMDLSQFNMGEVVVDQRCDGKSAWTSNSMQGDRDITGDQLQATLNNSVFPSPFLNYKESGATLAVLAKEKIGEGAAAREAYVLEFTPKAGTKSKYYFDAENFLELRRIMTLNVPEMGGDVEQMSESLDYRDVDGIKVPFVGKVVNTMQMITFTLSKVEHNKPIDDAMFSKPVK